LIKKNVGMPVFPCNLEKEKRFLKYNYFAGEYPRNGVEKILFQ